MAIKIKEKNHVFIILLLSFLSLLTAFSLVLLNNQNRQSILTKAQEEDPNFCQNTCIGQDRCGPNGPPGDPNYNAPCCDEVARTGDPLACPWPQRGYCTDAQCGAIPEGVSRQRCGGPRHSWCNKCVDAKCPGYGGASNPQPTARSSPTTAPQPTTAVEPTSPPEPTIAPPPGIILPTNPPPQPPPANTFNLQRHPVVAPTEIPQSITIPQFTLPQFSLPSFQIHLNGQRINEEAAKPLGFFESVFETVIQYDQLLEHAINTKFHSVFK